RPADQVALLHVDLDTDPALVRPLQDPGQVRGAGRTVDGQPQLGQLQRDGRVDPTFGDDLHSLQILPCRLARTGEILDPLAEKVEDGADSPSVEVDRRGHRVRQLWSRDESVHRL